MIKNCLICNQQFKIKPYRKDTAKYCSYVCAGKGIDRNGLNHPMFGKHHKPESKLKMSIAKKGKTHKTSRETRISISKALTGKKLSEETKEKIRQAHQGKPAYWNRGERSNMWKGGITSLNIAIRKIYKYFAWRKAVFEKQNYTCQMCGQRGGKLNADHIKPFSIILFQNKIKSIDEAILCDELWDENNGQTLCEPCHKKTDTFGGNSKITNKLLNKQVCAN